MEARHSANISNDRKVVLSALREVPEEVMFLLSESEQDPKKPNRYWFDFPSQWVNQPDKDAIVGIRDIYLTRTNRFIQYSYKITINDIAQQPIDPSVVYEPIDTIEGTITHWMGGDETIKKIVEVFNGTDPNSEGWIEGTRTTELTDEQHKWRKNEVVAYYGYDRGTNKTNLCFGRGIGQTSYYSYESSGIEYICPYGIEITPISDDAKIIFGIEPNETKTFKADPNVNGKARIEIHTWYRHQCLIKSSIAANDKNNFLGHTRNTSYTPLKYYRIGLGVKRFWIELYETRHHDSLIPFPTDGRDDLVIEAIVCFTAQAMI